MYRKMIMYTAHYTQLLFGQTMANVFHEYLNKFSNTVQKKSKILGLGYFTFTLAGK